MKKFVLLGPRFITILAGTILLAISLRVGNNLWLICSLILIVFGIGIDRPLRKYVSFKRYVPPSSMQDLDQNPMKVRISLIDYAPEDLNEQTPFEAYIIRRIPGKDRPDYWLAELVEPITWKQKDNIKIISHIVLTMRNLGDQMERKIKDSPVGIAYVIDQSLLSDNKLSFRKCSYVAIGIVNDISSANYR